MLHFKKQSVETQKLATVDLFLSPCFHIFKTPEVLGCGRDVMKFNSIQAGIKSTLVLTKFVIFFLSNLLIFCVYLFVFVTIVFEKCQNVFDIYSSNSFDIVQCKKHASMSILLQFSLYIFASTGLPKTLRRLFTRPICHIKDLQLEQITTNSK